MADFVDRTLSLRDNIAMPNALILVDYSNLLPRQKEAGVLDLVTRVLAGVDWEAGLTRGNCEVRLYGGWYEEDQITRDAQDLTVELQRDFPAIAQVPVEWGNIAFNTKADLAVSLLQEPAAHLFRTYRRKERVTNVRVQTQSVVGCTDSSCVLPLMKKILKSGSCPKAGCSIERDDLIFRHEQKIVDTMLTCDMVHATDRDYSKVILVSDDDDFIPPLRTVLLRGKSAVRCNPKPNRQRGVLSVGTAQVVEITV